MKKTIQPKLGTVVTMIIGILFLFLIFSQAGKYHASGYIVEKAEERLALREERKKVMLQIGVNDNVAIKVSPVKFPFKDSKKQPSMTKTNIKQKNSSNNNSRIIAQTNNESPKKRLRPGVYTVKQGDTLFGIAQKVYGDGNQWRKILKGNNKLKKPNQLRSGMKLNIPEPVENNTAYLKWQNNNKS